jgi:hypothetical protein
MKIHSFEEQSNSLIVSFASDTTISQNPDDYPSYAYQPVNMWPDISDPAEIKKRIAIAGVYLVEQQERQEKFVVDTNKIQEYRDMVGQVNSYSATELVLPVEESSTLEASNIVVI